MIFKPCPFCGGKVETITCDAEGNIRNEEYLLDPYSGISYQLAHGYKNNPKCPIAAHDEDGAIIGSRLYDTVEEAAQWWNEREGQK